MWPDVALAPAQGGTVSSKQDLQMTGAGWWKGLPYTVPSATSGGTALVFKRK